MFALGTFIGVGGERNDQVNGIDNNVASRLLGMATDGSPLVREVGSRVYCSVKWLWLLWFVYLSLCVASWCMYV